MYAIQIFYSYRFNKRRYFWTSKLNVMTGCLCCLGTVISHWVSFRDPRYSVRPKLFNAIKFHLIFWLLLTAFHMVVGPATGEKVTSSTDTQQTKDFLWLVFIFLYTASFLCYPLPFLFSFLPLLNLLLYGSDFHSEMFPLITKIVN